MLKIPTVKLNNGLMLPQLGLGTWQMNGHVLVDVVHAALDSGYRLVDTAAIYGNEEDVGKAIKSSGVPRSELFITTKLWNSDQGHDNTLKAFDKSLSRLGLDYVDLYLIHWPVPAADLYVETWKAMEEIYESGRAKAIGVCNFQVEHLEKLLASAKVVPAVNQIELHPGLEQAETRKFCKSNGIEVESWSPIGGTGGSLLENPIIGKIALKYKRSPAQIVIRWHIQLGLIVIPKSTNPERIKQNADVFDFKLDNDDMSKISSLDKGARRGPDPATMNSRMGTGIGRLGHKLGLVRLRRR